MQPMIHSFCNLQQGVNCTIPIRCWIMLIKYSPQMAFQISEKKKKKELLTEMCCRTIIVTLANMKHSFHSLAISRHLQWKTLAIEWHWWWRWCLWWYLKSVLMPRDKKRWLSSTIQCHLSSGKDSRNHPLRVPFPISLPLAEYQDQSRLIYFNRLLFAKLAKSTEDDRNKPRSQNKPKTVISQSHNIFLLFWKCMIVLRFV